MKKFIFSAVALIAFSFAGMANNEVQNDNAGNSCLVYAIRNTALEMADDSGMTDNEICESFQWYLDFCNSNPGNSGDVIIGGR